jgi:hypothetical protein
MSATQTNNETENAMTTNNDKIWNNNLNRAVSDVFRLAGDHAAAKEAGQLRFLFSLEEQIKSAQCRVRNARKALSEEA